MTNLFSRRVVCQSLMMALLGCLLSAAVPHSASAFDEGVYPSSTAAAKAGAAANASKDECDEGGAFYEAMNKSLQGRIAQLMAAHSNAYNEATNQARKNYWLIPLPWGEARMTLCLDDIDNFYNLLGMLLGRAGGILNMLINFVNQLLNLACQYVAAAINNLLTSICIPLPDLFKLPGFGGPERKSCNGISLADIYSVGVNPPKIPTISTDAFRRGTGLNKPAISRGAPKRATAN